ERAETFGGEPVPEFPGVSLKSAICGDAKTPEIERDYVYFNHSGNGALRVGDWKCLYTQTGSSKISAAEKSSGTANWALYNLAVDRSEQNDLAEKMPDKLNELVEKWRDLTKQFRELEKKE
ncbi:MAG: hypothetical protein ACRC2T_01980, partial [Thermoguttaceae bacterium]